MLELLILVVGTVATVVGVAVTLSQHIERIRRRSRSLRFYGC